jgi:hypothetical protein
MSIEAYDYGKQDGIAEERKRISDWLEKNHRTMNSSNGVFVYIDVTSLKKFLEDKEDPTSLQ